MRRWPRWVEVLVIGLLAGFVINACDVAVTVAFAATEWESVLRSQGLTPSSWTPPFYVSATFLGGVIWVAVYAVFRRSLAPTPATAAVVSLLLWGVSRLYGAGHVVMGQMPTHIFAIMSGGLLAGYLLGGQVGRWALERRLRVGSSSADAELSVADGGA